MPPRPRAERPIVFLYLVLACLTLAYNGYSEYETEYSAFQQGRDATSLGEFYRLHPTKALSSDHPFFVGRDHAPEQYRVLVPFLAKSIGDRLHMRKYYPVYVVFDFFAALATCLLYYLQLARSSLFRTASSSAQSAVVAFFLAAIAYPFAWTVAWERPETLPTSLYIAVMLFLLFELPGKPAVAVAVLAAAALQSFVRADVPATFGLAIVLFSLTRRAGQTFGSRAMGISLGGSVLFVAVAVQAYLKYVRFPAATYAPDTPVMQLATNLGIRHLVVFAIAIIPYFLLVAFAWKHRNRLMPLELLVLLASLVYFPLYCIVGLTGEVRIFVPYLLAGVPVFAKLLALEIGLPLGFQETELPLVESHPRTEPVATLAE